MKCINCGVATQRLRRHIASSLPGLLLNKLARWLTIEVPMDANICHLCFKLLSSERGNEVRLFGHSLICILCGRSVRSKQRHTVERSSSLLLNLPISHLAFHQAVNYTCHTCWSRHRRHWDQHQNSNMLACEPRPDASHRPGESGSVPIIVKTETIHEEESAEDENVGSQTKHYNEPSTSEPRPYRRKRKKINLMEVDEDVDDVDLDNTSDITEETPTFEYVPLPPLKEDGSEYKCKVCTSFINGFRYTCLECDDWDICGTCEARGEHSSHYVLRIPAARVMSDNDKILAAIRKHVEDLLKLAEAISEAEKTIKEEVIKEEAVDEGPEEFTTDTSESMPAVNYTVPVMGEPEVFSDISSQYIFFITNPPGPSNTALELPVLSEVNKPWTLVGNVLNDALVPNVTQAPSQCQEQRYSVNSVHKPCNE